MEILGKSQIEGVENLRLERNRSLKHWAYLGQKNPNSQKTVILAITLAKIT
jgi:hypothetical protein